MVNVYKIRKTVALFFVGLFTSIFFFVGLLYYGMWIGIATMFAGLITSYFVAVLFLKNPFTDMLEGKGILAIDLNSTGILNVFVVGVDPPYIKGKLRKKLVHDNFDREAVYNLKVPRKNIGPFARNVQVTFNDKLPVPPTPGQEMWKDEDGTIHFSLSEDKFNRAKFAMMQYPVLLYNSLLGSIITKDFIADQEKTAFAEHHIMFLTQMMQNLTSSVRDFGRYIVETLKPKNNAFGGKLWIWIIIGVVIVIIIMLFGPSLLSAFKGAGGAISTAGATTKAAAGGVITPA